MGLDAAEDGLGAVTDDRVSIDVGVSDFMGLLNSEPKLSERVDVGGLRARDFAARPPMTAMVFTQRGRP